MTTIVVRPANARNETAWFIGGVAALLLGSFILLTNSVTQQQEPAILDWQVSAFSDLNAVDQAIYNSLEVSGEEVFYVQYMVGNWPTMTDLYDFYLPPFYQDKSWEQWGKVNWEMKNIADTEEKTGSIAYHGSGGNIPGQSSYLLIVTHTHAGNSAADAWSVWINRDPNSSMPAVIKQPSLIRNGWRQVVPYSGEQERKRLKGD